MKKRLLALSVLFLVALSGCTGGSGSRSTSNSSDVALLGNRAKAIQMATNITSVLPYIYDPLELNVSMFLDGQPFCDNPLAAPECEDQLSVVITHQEIVDYYADTIAIGNQMDDYDFIISDAVVIVNGSTGTTAQTYSASNVPAYPGTAFDVSGAYQTSWTKVSGVWEMYSMTITIYFEIQ